MLEASASAYCSTQGFPQLFQWANCHYLMKIIILKTTYAEMVLVLNFKKEKSKLRDFILADTMHFLQH